MTLAITPEDEDRRLVVLRSYDVLDTPAERRFDRITGLVSAVLGAPIVLISLVDADRQWFKSRCGLDAAETGRDVSFCAHAILDDVSLVVPDATADPRFSDNPLVTGPPRIRTYLGVPLTSPCGAAIGTLCAMWSEVTPISPRQVEQAEDFARIVMEQLEAGRGSMPAALEARRRLHGR